MGRVVVDSHDCIGTRRDICLWFLYDIQTSPNLAIPFDILVECMYSLFANSSWFKAAKTSSWG